MIIDSFTFEISGAWSHIGSTKFTNQLEHVLATYSSKHTIQGNYPGS